MCGKPTYELSVIHMKGEVFRYVKMLKFLIVPLQLDEFTAKFCTCSELGVVRACRVNNYVSYNVSLLYGCNFNRGYAYVYPKFVTVYTSLFM